MSGANGPIGHILTLNAGSSSLKTALFEAGTLALVASGQIEGLGSDPHLDLHAADGGNLLSDPLEGARFAGDHAQALTILLDALRAHVPGMTIVATGHRVVHGGLDFTAPVAVDAGILARLARLNPLAPLHQPHNLAGIEAAMRAFPAGVHVACFDTAFHRAHPFVADTFALPRALYDEGVRRYGFHGISYEYIAGRLAEIAPKEAAGRVIVCHLGSGASMCALKAGRSVASTMGFSALDGLPMGTRPGQLDPGVVLYLLDQKGMTPSAISDLLYKQSGLKGLSGVSNDMRVLEASDSPHAREAIDYFVFRARREIGALAAVLEGLDAIVFCGGIGEHSALIRAAILGGMGWCGIEVDAALNDAHAMVISPDQAKVRVFVIPTNEEIMIARHCRAVMAGMPR
jgi:acetate kinase